MLHFQIRKRVLDDGLAAEVRGGQHVCNVAVDEDFAGLEAQDRGLGDAGVGAAEPEDLRVLGVGEGGEEFGVLAGAGGGPGFVLLEGLLEGVGVCAGGEGG